MQETSSRQYGRPFKLSHPFTDALRAAGISVSEWARSHGYTPARVGSWYRSTDGHPIPRAAAEAIEKQFPAVKATPRVWRWGISD